MGRRRYSKQREQIYACLKQTDRHPTADMIYQWLKPAHPNLSLGTVYRNLKLLADEGEILRLAFPVERYDACALPHAHFQCDQCGEVFDLDMPYDKGLDRAASRAGGHTVRGHDLVFRGMCAHCLESGG